MNATALLVLHLQAKRLPAAQFEYRFAPPRRWRWDLCWPDQKLAVEIHGGVHRGGRHTRGVGFTRDREKINAGIELGWRCLEYVTSDVESGAAIRQLERMLR